MKTGDLVACRLDSSVRIGIITGKWKGSEHTFMYADGRYIHTNNLPRSRFILLNNHRHFSNFCSLIWSQVRAKNPTDASKLRRWLATQPSEDTE